MRQLHQIRVELETRHLTVAHRQVSGSVDSRQRAGAVAQRHHVALSIAPGEDALATIPERAAVIAQDLVEGKAKVTVGRNALDQVAFDDAGHDRVVCQADVVQAGEVELDELLSHRDKLNLRIQSILDQHTAPWGVKVANVEVKQVDMPESMLRAMAKQAEAEREKRSKIIHAEGEFSAAQRLVDAAHLLASEPTSIQLRYLQTLTEIGVEKNTTIVFPIPIDLMEGLNKLLNKSNKEREPVAGT